MLVFSYQLPGYDVGIDHIAFKMYRYNCKQNLSF